MSKPKSVTSRKRAVKALPEELWVVASEWGGIDACREREAAVKAAAHQALREDKPTGVRRYVLADTTTVTVVLVESLE